jgi:cobalt/nickel transport system permease protein
LRHDFFDSHCHGKSLLGLLDPRSKLVATLAFVVAITVILPNSYFAYLAYFGIAIVFMIMSKVSLNHYLQALLLIAPLVITLVLAVPFINPGTGRSFAVDNDLSLNAYKLSMLVSLVSKTVLSYLFSLVLLFTTNFASLMEAFGNLGIPKIFVMIANFAYRYQFIIVDEAERLARSRNSRLWQPRFITQAKTIGYMAGTLFLRSYERSERVYMAMSSRGFTGKFVSHQEMKFKPADFAYLLFVAAANAAVWIWLT